MMAHSRCLINICGSEGGRERRTEEWFLPSNLRRSNLGWIQSYMRDESQTFVELRTHSASPGKTHNRTKPKKVDFYLPL